MKMPYPFHGFAGTDHQSDLPRGKRRRGQEIFWSLRRREIICQFFAHWAGLDRDMRGATVFKKKLPPAAKGRSPLDTRKFIKKTPFPLYSGDQVV
jgi:hypothetical protein